MCIRDSLRGSKSAKAGDPTMQIRGSPGGLEGGARPPGRAQIGTCGALLGIVSNGHLARTARQVARA
eukprot:9160409-Alexandrium_andersonii.AAC.1